MKARAQLERLYGGGPAPVEAPPKPGIKPGVRPAERPGAPGPGRRQSPLRRKDIKPGQEPAPKSRYAERMHSEAIAFLKANDLGEFVR
jgi:hypothetical protein